MASGLSIKGLDAFTHTRYWEKAVAYLPELEKKIKENANLR